MFHIKSIFFKDTERCKRKQFTASNVVMVYIRNQNITREARYFYKALNKYAENNDLHFQSI